MTPFRQAHRPQARWRYLAGLAVETVVLGALFVAVIVAAGLAGPR